MSKRKEHDIYLNLGHCDFNLCQVLGMSSTVKSLELTLLNSLVLRSREVRKIDAINKINTLYLIKFDNFGIYLDGVFLSNSLTISNFNLSVSNIINFKNYNKEGCTYPGGFNISLKDFGDYKQDIIMDVKYE